jgi:hypothetical protein
MSTADLHQIAQHDTPNSVNVPATWAGLVMWAVGRFGGGVIIAAAFAYAAHRVYEDNAALSRQMLTVLQDLAVVQSKSAAANEQLARAVEALTREAQIGHQDVLPRR